jgi:hypothetical protein
MVVELCIARGNNMFRHTPKATSTGYRYVSIKYDVIVKRFILYFLVNTRLLLAKR